MKIGVMLRHLDQHGGGVLVYTENLLERLPAVAPEHEFVFIYANESHLGRYKGDNVREVVCRVPSKLGWDQIGMLQCIRREKLDVLFNPKYSVPLLAGCPTVFVCHGLDWYVMPWGSKLIDRLSHRYLMPRYAKKASSIIAVSDTTKQHLLEFLGVDDRKAHSIHLGVDERFSERADPAALKQLREKYSLPENYLLYVGQIYPPKNFARLLRAFAEASTKIDCELVVAGSHTWLCEDDLKLIDELGISDRIIRPGWIGRDELPAFYQLATALVLPSLYEACPSPPLEAMSSGCPVLTSNRYGTKEIAGEAALLVDPESVESIAQGMIQIVTDEALRQTLIERGKQRATEFSWDICARETLNVLVSTGRK